MTDGTLAPLLDRSWARALEDAEARHGDRSAFHFEGPQWHQELTFSQWLSASRAIAGGLWALGVRHGDRVAALAPGSAMWPILQTACSHLGAIIVPINTRYRQDELGYVFTLTQPKVIVLIGTYNSIDYVDLVTRSLDGQEAELVTLASPVVGLTGAEGPGANGHRDWEQLLSLGEQSDVPPMRGTPDDAVLLQFTSGTSAFPKGALLSSRATLGATWYLAERMGVTSDDIYFSTQPMYHVGGSVATTLMALGASPIMIVPERYTPEAAFELISRYRCTARTGQAAMYAMELAHPEFSSTTFASLTRAWSGGTPELRRIISREMGVPVMTTIYGLTETAGTTTINSIDDPEEVWLNSCGRAIPGVEVGISTDEGVTTDPDVMGEIVVRGWSVMLGYFANDDATAEAIDADGWFHTGDLGRLDSIGNLYFVDRLKDMIKPGGENVSAAEVERVIQSFPGVAQVAVVGRPDERLGQVPVAFVQMSGADFDAAAIIAHCSSLMASFKVPREVFEVASWPMTESGKILKRELAARFGTGTGRLVGQGG